jgi:hypothetical protein
MSPTICRPSGSYFVALRNYSDKSLSGLSCETSLLEVAKALWTMPAMVRRVTDSEHEIVAELDFDTDYFMPAGRSLIPTPSVVGVSWGARFSFLTSHDQPSLTVVNNQLGLTMAGRV